MIKVKRAAGIIDAAELETKIQEVDIAEAVGMVLREPITSDRDLPPFDRVMMDGIAIRFDQWEQGRDTFPVEGLQKAGAPKQQLTGNEHCLEVMTGAILPENTDTVIRYEDIKILKKDGKNVAVINRGPKKRGQNIHPQGTNRQKGTMLVEKGTLLGSAEIAVAATVGKSVLKVTRPPRVAIISTGDELVDITEEPLPHQIRRSNVYAISAALKKLDVDVTLFHLQDEKEQIFEELGQILEQFDVLILSGGVSKGKLDFIPEVLEERGVQKKFHKVRQRPGKPFWFGTSDKAVVFALPGNPVSSFICYYRYVQPWLQKQMSTKTRAPFKAQLVRDFSFTKKLTYFLQVDIEVDEEGILCAMPVKGKGSSDLANLCKGDGFLELPEERNHYRAGESYPLYLYRSL